MKSSVIVGAKRTPIGAYRGQLAGLAAPDLGAVAIRALLDGLPPRSHAYR